jgi:diguanylate cyclase (GGDEF)-like protein
MLLMKLLFPPTRLDLELLSSIDSIGLFPVSQTCFHLLDIKPKWLDLLGNATNQRLLLNQKESFLENFLIDARNFWSSNSKGILLSGRWVQTDDHGIDHPFEAIATVLKGNPVLLVQRITGSYLEIRRILQSARENAIQQEKFERLVYQDFLTGLYNRRGFLLHAEEQLLVARCHKQAVTIVCIDLDRLKWVNDKFGHKVGDQVIINAAALFKKTFRKRDVLARVGGDEFLALMVNMDSEETLAFNARLKQSVDEWNAQQEPHFQISFSIGLASDDTKLQALEQLVSQADANMYMAKRNKKQMSIATHMTT